MQSFDIVESGPGYVWQRDLINNDVDPAQFRHHVTVFPGIEVHRVLKTRASAANYRDPQAVLCAESFFSIHFAHGLGRAWGQIYTGRAGLSTFIMGGSRVEF